MIVRMMVVMMMVVINDDDDNDEIDDRSDDDDDEDDDENCGYDDELCIKSTVTFYHPSSLKTTYILRTSHSISLAEGLPF